MYKKSLFTSDTGVACVVSVAKKGMGVDEDVQTKFIKIVII